jgi:hypothetical protein
MSGAHVTQTPNTWIDTKQNGNFLGGSVKKLDTYCVKIFFYVKDFYTISSSSEKSAQDKS